MAAVADVFYIFNSTVVDWTCFFFFLINIVSLLCCYMLYVILIVVLLYKVPIGIVCLMILNCTD